MSQPDPLPPSLWLGEVNLMRVGMDPYWNKWSPITRAGWARNLLEIAHEDGFAFRFEREVKWLESVIRDGEDNAT